MSAVAEPLKPRGGSELVRQRRRRNWALLAALIAFVVVVYLVALTKMGGL